MEVNGRVAVTGGINSCQCCANCGQMLPHASSSATLFFWIENDLAALFPLEDFQISRSILAWEVTVPNGKCAVTGQHLIHQVGLLATKESNKSMAVSQQFSPEYFECEQFGDCVF